MKIIKGNTYKERNNYQLNEWVKGNPIHNTIDNECCPDFSCCKPENLQPLEVRETFKSVCMCADKETFNPDFHPMEDAKMGMLMSFLENAFSKELSKKKVYITDGDMSYKKDLN